jgi:hypothetical protein
MLRILLSTVLIASQTALIGEAWAQSPASRAEITKAFVGRTVVFGDGGEATYTRDGRYRFTGYGQTWTGKYTIANGEICVTFDRAPGGVVTPSRCDKITKQGDSFTLTNMSGRSFSVRFK